jgi:cytosine/uracil/thiamine/allantoin permease
LYNYAWFVGFFVSGVVYLMASPPRPSPKERVKEGVAFEK